jgi:hypothetical protein
VDESARGAVWLGGPGVDYRDRRRSARAAAFARRTDRVAAQGLRMIEMLPLRSTIAYWICETRSSGHPRDPRAADP